MLGFGALGEFALGEISRATAAPPVDPDPGDILDATKISRLRTVVFEGSGSRVVVFN